jgi:hypothetical protein
MQLDALVGWTIMPPSGSEQCVSAGPGVGFPGLLHMVASESPPPSVMPLLDPEPLLEPELLPDPELLELLEVDPLLDVLPLPEPELEPVLSLPPSADEPLLSELHATKIENTNAADDAPKPKRREAIDRSRSMESLLDMVDGRSGIRARAVEVKSKKLQTPPPGRRLVSGWAFVAAVHISCPARRR